MISKKDCCGSLFLMFAFPAGKRKNGQERILPAGHADQ